MDKKATTYSTNLRKSDKRILSRKNENKTESESSESLEQKSILETSKNRRTKEKEKNRYQEIESTKLESERENRFLGKKTESSSSEYSDKKENTFMGGNKRKKITFINITEDESEESEDELMTTEEKKKRTIYARAYNSKILERDLFKIFKGYGNISKVQIKSPCSGLVEFSDISSVQKVMENKNKIFFNGRKLKIENSFNIIPENINLKIKKFDKKAIENELRTEESKKGEIKNEKFIDMELKPGNIIKDDDGYAKLEEKFGKFLEEFNENKKETEEIKSQLDKSKKETEEIKSQLAKKSEELEQNIKETKDIKSELAKKSKEIDDLKVNLNIMAQINEQKDIYYKSNFINLINNINLLMNSYKLLYIRKFANLLLEKIYKKYSKSLVKGKVNNHIIIALSTKVKNKLGNNYYKINLIIDFLRFIWNRCSSAIHINDENFPLQKELFYEYLKPLKKKKTSSKNKSEIALEINDLIGLIFEKKERKTSKGNKIQAKDNNLITNIRGIIKKKENTKTNDKDYFSHDTLIIQLSEPEELFDSDDLFDEKEIEKIIKENLQDCDMGKKIKELIQLIKKNKNKNNLIESDNAEISGEYFYNLWLKTFYNESYKSKEKYLLYFKKEEI